MGIDMKINVKNMWNNINNGWKEYELVGMHKGNYIFAVYSESMQGFVYESTEGFNYNFKGLNTEKEMARLSSFNGG